MTGYRNCLKDFCILIILYFERIYRAEPGYSFNLKGACPSIKISNNSFNFRSIIRESIEFLLIKKESRQIDIRLDKLISNFANY